VILHECGNDFCEIQTITQFWNLKKIKIDATFLISKNLSMSQ
jgi:hypothetical protein